MGLSLHQHGHSHGHDSHKSNQNIENEEIDEEDLSRDKRNINVRAAFIHVLGDFIQSVGVFVAALVIYFKVYLYTHTYVLMYGVSSVFFLTNAKLLRSQIGALSIRFAPSFFHCW